MAKSAKRRFLSLLNLLICFALFCCLIACGSGGSRGVDSTAIASFTGSPTSLNAGQSSILTVEVTDSEGKPVSNATVNFEFTNNNSGATITPLSSGSTDASGQAVAFYTAGSTNPGADVEDTIQASVAGSTGAVIITRTAATTVTGADYISNLTAEPTTVSGGHMSIITATVRHVGEYDTTTSQTITFTIPINNSDASLIDSNGTSVSTITIPMQLAWNTFTDVSVTYKAGTNVSGAGVQDVVQAVLGNDSTNSFLINITP